MDMLNGSAGNDLTKLASEVLKYYNITPESITVIQSGTIKTVWKIKYKGKFYCLKRLKQTYDKALFSVNAQVYISNNGGNVPGIMPDSSNQVIVNHNEQLFVLYEWVPGRDLDFSNKADLSLAIKGLAAFHNVSKGYVPLEDARTSSKLGKWPEQYNSMKNKLIAWKEVSKANEKLNSHSSYLKVVDSIIDIANNAIKRIENSDYQTLTSPGSNTVVLCHQDYGKGNAVLADKGVVVIDLDGVTFDHPARDLRKLIGKMSENKGQWLQSTIDEISGWYSEVNPLKDNDRKVLYIDLLFPHWFYGLIKNQFQNNKLLKSSEIERIAKLEQTKVALLETLIGKDE